MTHRRPRDDSFEERTMNTTVTGEQREKGRHGDLR
jgi:hypothetical protein